MRSRRFAASPIFIISESPASCMSGLALIGILTGRDYFPGTREPFLKVLELLGCRAGHHSGTASRKMSSSIPGFRPP